MSTPENREKILRALATMRDVDGDDVDFEWDTPLDRGAKVGEGATGLAIYEKDLEECGDDWESEHPIFMTRLPDEKDADDFRKRSALENMEELQHILAEGPPIERATTFKRNGNEAFGAKNYRDALAFYTRAIDALLELNEEEMKNEGEEYVEMLSVVYSNRAAVHTKLKNYKRCCLDCQQALKWDPCNYKAYWRGAKSREAVGKYQEAIDWAMRGLVVGEQQAGLQDNKHSNGIPNNPKAEGKGASAAVKKGLKLVVKGALEALKRISERKEATLQAAAKVENEERAKRERLLKDGIRMGKLEYEIPHNALLKWGYDEAEKQWFFPCAFLYPQFNQSDYVQEFYESVTCGDHLSVIFQQRPPWDEQSRFRDVSSLHVYVEMGATRRDDDTGAVPAHKWVRVRLTTPLSKILRHKDYVLPGIVLLHVLAPGKDRDDFVASLDK